MMTTFDASTDFIIVTAVEDEFKYFTNFVRPDFGTNANWHSDHDWRNMPFFRGHFSVQKDESYFTVLIAQATTLGGAHSVVRSALLLRQFHPSVGIAMCGVCAADKKRDLNINLGDVIAPRKIFYKSYGKLIEKVERPSWDSVNQQYIPEPASSFDWRSFKEDLAEKFPPPLVHKHDQVKIPYPPVSIEDFSLHTQYNILTTDHVTVDEEFFETINQAAHHNIHALDMESYHLALLAREFQLNFVFMKGVQDYAGPALARNVGLKSDHFREFACCASAKLLIEYLRKLFKDGIFTPRYVQYEETKPIRLEKALKAEPFLSWLFKRNSERPFPPAVNYHGEQLSSKGMNKQEHCQIAAVVVVHSAGSKDSPRNVAEGYSDFAPSIEGQYSMQGIANILKANERFVASLEKKLDGIKGTPTSVFFPLSESPMQIQMAMIDYNTVYAFHSAVITDAKLQTQLVDDAFKFIRSTRAVDELPPPGILTLDTVVITQDRYVILGHRRYRPDGYYGNTWSASFEEQFSAVENPLKARTIPRDETIKAAVLRGLKEEILPYSLRDGAQINVTLHALYLDLVALNWQLLAVVKLENITFSRLHNFWIAPGEVSDRAEHDYLWALKIDPSFLEAAVYSNDLSRIAEFGEESLVQNCPKSVGEELVLHQWQPRSQVRLACCWWMSENGLL